MVLKAPGVTLFSSCFRGIKHNYPNFLDEALGSLGIKCCWEACMDWKTQLMGLKCFTEQEILYSSLRLVPVLDAPNLRENLFIPFQRIEIIIVVSTKYYLTQQRFWNFLFSSLTSTALSVRKPPWNTVGYGYVLSEWNDSPSLIHGDLAQKSVPSLAATL